MTFSEKNCNTCGQKCAIKYHGCSNWIPMQSGWIPVSERLPKEGEEVLVSGYDTYHKKVVVAKYQGEKYGFTCGLVPAWMPLPKPYEPQAEYKDVHCNCTDEEIAKSFISDVETVKDLLPQAESEDKEC